MARLSIRPFGQRDARAVFHLFETTEELQVCGLSASLAAVERWHITRTRDVILVAERDGTIVGFIAAQIDHPEPGCAYIESVAVTPEHRGQTIGQQLVDRCTVILRAKGVHFLNLHVRTDAFQAIRFWERNGFTGKAPMLWMYKPLSREAILKQVQRLPTEEA
jgi:ribosomal protein S18 acetylase RimI-like enzyme